MDREEIWKDIDGYGGAYQISNTGHVKSVGRFILTSDGRKRPIRERILKPSKRKDGYLMIVIYKSLKRNYILIHRLVGILFVDNPNNKPEINHNDGDKANNNDWNLSWTTRLENMRHAHSMGLIKQPIGEKRHNAKLKELDIIHIRESYAKGEYTYQELANKYSITKTNIGCIIRRKSWTHLK